MRDMNNSSGRRPRTHGPVCGAATDHGPCGNPAGWGTSHVAFGSCRKHLGNAPAHVAHAQRLMAEQAEAEARAALERMNVEPMTNPLDQLAQLAAEAKAWYDAMRAKVAGLESLTLTDRAGREQVRGAVILLERAADRLAAICVMLAKLNIDERIVEVQARIGEVQAAQMVVVVHRAHVRSGRQSPFADDGFRQVFADVIREMAAEDLGDIEREAFGIRDMPPEPPRLPPGSPYSGDGAESGGGEGPVPR